MAHPTTAEPGRALREAEPTVRRGRPLASRNAVTCQLSRCDRQAYRRKLCRQHYFYEREQRARDGETISRKIDPARARTHLQELIRLGHTTRSLSYLSGGLSREVIRRVLYEDGPINSTTELCLLRIPIHQHRPWQDLDDNYLFLSIGTKRRLQALLAVGWTQLEIARRCGIQQSAVTAIVRGKRERCLVHVVRAVSDLYDEIEHQTAPLPPNKAVRSYRWPVPAEWDPEAIDDPDAEYDSESRRKGKRKQPLPHAAEGKGPVTKRMHEHLAYGRGRPRVAAKDQAKVCAAMLDKGHKATAISATFRKSSEWVYAKAREAGWTPASTPGGESGKLQEVS